MTDIARRKILQAPALLAASTAAAEAADDKAAAGRKLKVIACGAHPDDPESSCGGTIARCADLGHEVVILYLTRGEAGIRGKAHAEAAAIRTAEAQRACAILKAR